MNLKYITPGSRDEKKTMGPISFDDGASGRSVSPAIVASVPGHDRIDSAINDPQGRMIIPIPGGYRLVG